MNGVYTELKSLNDKLQHRMKVIDNDTIEKHMVREYGIKEILTVIQTDLFPIMTEMTEKITKILDEQQQQEEDKNGI